MEQTLVFIKPDGVQRGLVGSIIRRFEERGIQLIQLKKMQISSDLSDRHYEEHLQKPFYSELKEYVTSGDVIAMVLEAEGVVSVVRTMCGATNSAQADPGTIRGDYALTTAFNVIHSSDSPTSAQREIANFFG